MAKQNIGQNIRAIRKELRLSQDDLATRAGYKNSAIIVAIENGNTEPSYEKIKDISNALGVSIYQVKGQEKFRKVTSDGIYYSEADAIALNLLSPLISEMTDSEIDKVLDYATLLLHANNKEANWKLAKFQTQGGGKGNAKVEL